MRGRSSPACESGDDELRVANGHRDRSRLGVLFAQHAKIVVPKLINYQRESICLTYDALAPDSDKRAAVLEESRIGFARAMKCLLCV